MERPAQAATWEESRRSLAEADEQGDHNQENQTDDEGDERNGLLGAATWHKKEQGARDKDDKKAQAKSRLTKSRTHHSLLCD
jgi:hypothetical protein